MPGHHTDHLAHSGHSTHSCSQYERSQVVVDCPGKMAWSIGADALLSDGGGDGALLVTAHPDDESMFFAPTVLALKGVLRLHVLCLSTGDYDGLGRVRAVEIVHACAVLGVPAERVTILDEPDVRDGPHTNWPAARVAHLVQRELELRSLGRVITFDGCGVTNHPNHVAVHLGVRSLVDTNSGMDAADSPRVVTPRTYVLHSTGPLRRLMGWWDLVPTILAILWHLRDNSSPRLCCCVNLRPWACHAAMRAHKSQYVWYRRLYVMLSRYVFVNTLEAL